MSPRLVVDAFLWRPVRKFAVVATVRIWPRLALGAAFCWAFCSVTAAAADDATILRAMNQTLSQQLSHNQFQRPLVLVSVESSSALKGDIYAVLDYPFASVNRSLNDPALGPANWCDVLILHTNTKYCHALTTGNGAVLKVNIGAKTEQALADSSRMEFQYHPVTSSTDYFKVELVAASGPMSTTNYRIVLEAVALDDRHTFLHLTYAYGYGFTGRIAMAGYLATVARNKVGFTLIRTQPVEYIAGLRGTVERNSMRYYLAIDAYLASLATAPDKQLEQRLTRWFDSIEQYPRQLHDVERADYMPMKYNEYRRQQTVQ